MCLPGLTELALTVLIGQTFVLLMGLPVQTKLALTGIVTFIKNCNKDYYRNPLN